MKNIIDRSECMPLSENIEGKLVVIGEDHFVSEYKEAKYQLVLAIGGFGCYADKLGTAVFVQELHSDNPERYRRERYDLIGEPTEKMIEEWKELYGEFNETAKMILKQVKEGKYD